MLKDIRAFFDARHVMEVETPAMSRSATTEVHLESYQVACASSPDVYYLHTSPELAMKRLLADGSGDIYQICRVFRANESGRRHNPEFTLLEWYRIAFDMQTLMQEVAELIISLLADKVSATPVYRTYRQVFQEYLACDPLDCKSDTLSALYQHHTGSQPPTINDHQQWLDLLLSDCIQPQLPLDTVVFITHFPAAQCSLASLDKDDPHTCRRFEVFVNGMELANGFEELIDASQQSARIHAELAERKRLGLQQVKVDQYFLQAIEHGLPSCSGVAVGLDRLLMLLTGKTHIDEVMTFSHARI